MIFRKTILFIIFLTLLPQICFGEVLPIDDVPVSSYMNENTQKQTIIGTKYENTYILLNYLGIVTQKEDEIDPMQEASKGYAAALFARILNPQLMQAEISPYKDVKSTGEYANGIYTAWSLGILNKGEKMFFPNKAISPNEAAEMLIRVLGYSITNPNVDPVLLGINLGLFDKIDYSAQKMTVGDILTIIHNAFKTNSLEIDRISEGKTFQISTDKNSDFLLSRKNISLQEGILTAVGCSSIFGDTEMDREHVEINRKKLKSVSNVDYSLLGKKIYAYIDTSKDEDTVINVWEAPGKNETAEINGDSIIRVSASELIYEEDGANDKKIRVNGDTTVIYNGTYYGKLQKAVSDNLFESLSKAVTIDNDKDGTADILIADKYRNFVVQSVSSYLGTISFKYDYPSIDTTGSNIIFELSLDGAPVKISALKEWDVLSVLISERQDGKKLYQTYISSKTETGILTQISGDDNTYLLNGTQYKLSDEYQDFLKNNTTDIKPIIGSKSDFYFSIDNQIVASVSSSSFNFAYLMAAAQEKSVAAEYKLKLYTFNGKAEIFTLNDDIKFYNNEFISGKTMSDSDVYNKIRVNDHYNCNMIAYKLNSGNKISELALELDQTSSNPGEIDYPVIKNFAVGGTGNIDESARFYVNVMSRKYRMNGSVNIITAPGDMSDRADEKYYSLKNPNYFNRDHYFINEKIVLYNVNKYYSTGFAVIEGGSAKGTIDPFSNSYMVKSIAKVLDADGLTAIKINYMDDNNENSIIVNDDTKIAVDSDTESWYGSPDSPDEISAGDIIQWTKNSLGYADLVRVLFKSNNRGKYRTQWQSETILHAADKENPFDVLGLIYGKVVNLDSNTIIVNVSDSGDDENYQFPEFIDDFYGKTRYTLFESETNKVTGVTLKEIRKGDSVVIRKHFNSVCDVFVIK